MKDNKDKNTLINAFTYLNDWLNDACLFEYEIAFLVRPVWDNWNHNEWYIKSLIQCAMIVSHHYSLGIIPHNQFNTIS